MRLNKLLLVSIFVLAIFTLGAVSAAEDVSVDEITADGDDAEVTAVSEDVTDGELSATQQDDVLSDPVAPTYTYDFNLPMSGSAYVAQWGQPIIVSANYTHATGNVTITFAGETYTTDLIDGAFTFEVTKYTKIANNQAFKVQYNGDENYSPVSFQKNIHIQMNDVAAHDAYYGLNPYVEVNLHNATGNVTFTVNGVTYRKELVNGTAIQEFTNYTLGRNTVAFAYEGDENFNPISKSYNFNANANIEAPTIYNFQPAIITVYMGEATGNVTFAMSGESYIVPIENGKATCVFENYVIGSNTVSVAYSGDDTFNPFSTTKKFDVLNKENATILSSVYRTADKNMVIICIPFGTGNVNVTINGKDEVLELIDGVAYYNIGADDNITEINVKYDGNNRLNPANSTEFKELNNIVNNDNYMYYFNQADGGKIFEFIEDGTTLDFQGSIINPDQENKVYFDVSKPVNIITTTGDAYIDLNTTAGSLLGENPGNRFTVSYGGSWSNITGINFHNTQLWVFNTHHVVLDRISNVIEDQRVGSGVGATSIRANSTWVTVKNSYFYTRNNGGSSSLVIAWADYCTFDNNTIVVEGNVGNMIYLTTYNVDIPSGVLANVYNNITNNRILAHDKTPAAICWGLVISGAHNYVADNYIDYGGVGINQQWGQGDFINNTYTGNVLVGASANFLPTSIVYNNTIGGTASTGANTVFFNNTVGKALTVGADAEAYDNTAGGLTLSGAGSYVHDNVINGATTISQANIIVENNTFLGDNTIKFSAANTKNVTFANNSVVGNIEFGNKNAKGNIITGNNITTSKNYAIDLKTYTGTETVMTDNILNSNNGFGNAAINHKEDDTLVIDNYQNETAGIIITAEDIKVGQTAVFNITCNVTSVSEVAVLVDNKQYTVKLVDGKGTLEVEGLLANTYTVRVSSLDETYGAQNTTTLTVSKNDCPEIVVVAPEKTQWVDSDITVTIADATGTVKLSINGAEVSADLVDGVAVLAVPDLAIGEYEFTITYSGDYKYLGNQTTGTLKVNKNKEVKIIASDVRVDVVADKFTAQFTNYIGEAIANADVTITIGDAVYSLVTDENGMATADITLYRGKYDVNVAFKAIEDEYDAAEADFAIYVSDSSIMTIISVDGDGVITGSLTDAAGTPIANAVISATMNNVETNITTDDAGQFKFQAQNGYKVDFVFNGDDISQVSSASFTLNNVGHVLKDVVINLTNMSVYAVDTGAGEKGKVYIFTLTDGQGNAIANKDVQVVLNGKVYDLKTDANGSANVTLALSVSKIYNLNAFFIGDDDYKGATAVAKIKVVKKATVLRAAKTKYIFKVKAKNKIILAALKTSNKYLKAGKKVILKIRGLTFVGKTAKNGLVKFNIGKLAKKGTYTGLVKFAGDYTYRPAAAKTLIVVR